MERVYTASTQSGLGARLASTIILSLVTPNSLQSLPMQEQQLEIWSVSQLTRRIKTLLEAAVGSLWVAGEISNWKEAASGHAYFTLKDEHSQIDAVLFRGRLNRLKFDPKSGLDVIARGQVTVYERRGNYQIVIDDMQPKGVGALQLAFEELKHKLEAEGLFAEENKKSLPMLPRRIGLVTSPTGAAIRDILHVILRRFANVHVTLYPVRVQGEHAAAEIVEGIRALDRWGIDVMIIGRGGGSLEDLWPFNEEAVVRAVYEAETPVISAVGHEIDSALTDFVADVRAPTPSAAAELVVQEQEALHERVRRLEWRLITAMGRDLERLRHRFTIAQGSFVFARPEELLRQRRQESDELCMRLDTTMREYLFMRRARAEQASRAVALLSPVGQLKRAVDKIVLLRPRLLQAVGTALERKRSAFKPLLAQLEALSPLSILSRGYALAWKLPERTLVRTALELTSNDKIYLRFAEGSATAVITKVEETQNGKS